MSINVMNWVWKHSTTKGSDRLVLIALADSANDDGVCWPSLATIADKCNLGKRYVINILAKLEETGCIQKVERFHKNGNKSNLYVVVTDQVVNPDSLGSELGFTTGSEQEITRVVNRGSPKPLMNHKYEPPGKHAGETPAPPPPPAPEKISPLLPDTPAQLEFFALMVPEYKAKGRNAPKKFTTMACKQKFIEAEKRLSDAEIAAATIRAFEKGIMSVSSLVDFVGKWGSDNGKRYTGANHSPEPAGFAGIRAFVEGLENGK